MIAILIAALLALAALVVVLRTSRAHPRHEFVFHLIAACQCGQPGDAIKLPSGELRRRAS